MKRAAIYMRVSTEKQAQEGDSIPAQREALHKYIDSRPDLLCVGEYLDDGISGTKYDRDQLQRLISDVKAGNIDLIIVTKMDRLHRSLKNFLDMQEILDRHNCAWLAIWEPVYDTSTPQGRMIINTMMNLAQFEAENTGQRIRQVQSYKVSQGNVISGTCPPGYSIEDKKLVPNSSAQKVKELFEHYSLHGSMASTMRLVADDPNFPHSPCAFKNMLKNETYIGKKRDNNCFCEPIISQELFDDVQRKLSINIKKSQKHTYIFSGLLRCAECGHSMAAFQFYKKRPTKTYHTPSYRCATRYARGGIRGCDNPKVITESVLEKYLLENIRAQIKGMILEYEIEEKPARDNSRKISKLEKKKDRLKELYLNGLIGLDEYKADREQIESEISSLTSQKPLRSSDLSSLKELLSTDFESLYGTFTAEEKRFFWRSIIKEIQFDKNRNYKIIFLD